jgi:hypothetical protein
MLRHRALVRLGEVSFALEKRSHLDSPVTVRMAQSAP